MCIIVVCVLIWDWLLDAETPESLAPAGTKSYKEMQRKDNSVSVKVKREKGKR